MGKFGVGSTVECRFIGEEEIQCGDIKFQEDEHSLELNDTMFWVFLASAGFFTLFAGLMSGLNIGYFSLNQTNLSVMLKGKDAKMRDRAKKVMGIVKRKHMLLVTLLLSNAFAMESLPLCLDRIFSPIISIIMSVTAVLFFGEVIPQSICSRYALEIGSFFAYPVYALMVLTSPVSFPIAKLLDFLLGEDHGTYYKRDELAELVNMHGDVHESNQEPLTIDEVSVIKGALQMKNKSTVDCMTPLEKVFMLSDQTVFTQQVFETIIEKGHSRIPIYRKDNREDVIGLILTKKLINMDISSSPKLSEMDISPIMRFQKEFPLYSILNEFQTGRGHLSLVCDGNNVIGIITIEDVIEELIQEEIFDEADGMREKRKEIIIGRMNAQLLSTSPNSSNAPR